MEKCMFEFRVTMTNGSTHYVEHYADSIDSAWIHITRTGDMTEVRAFELVHVPDGAE